MAAVPAATMGFKWLTDLLVALGPSVLGLFFGGNKGTSQLTTQTSLPQGYQSPTLGLQDLLMQSALGNNLNMLGGAGMPGGGTIAPNFLEDFLSLIGSEYQNLQKKTQQPNQKSAGAYGGKYKAPTSASYGNYAGL